MWRGEPCVCRIVKEGNEEIVYMDSHFLKTREEIAKVPYQKNGCRVEFGEIAFGLTEALIEENYPLKTRPCVNPFRA